MIAGAGRRLRTRQNHRFDQQEPKIAPAGEGEGSVWSAGTTSTQGKIGKGPLEKARFWPPAPFSVMRIEAQRASEEDRSPPAFPHANTWSHFRKRMFGWCMQAWRGQVVAVRRLKKGGAPVARRSCATMTSRKHCRNGSPGHAAPMTLEQQAARGRCQPSGVLVA